MVSGMCLQNNHILDLNNLGTISEKKSLAIWTKMVKAKLVLGLEPGNSARSHFGEKLRKAVGSCEEWQF